VQKTPQNPVKTPRTFKYFANRTKYMYNTIMKDTKQLKQDFAVQRWHATKTRNIDWELTFDEWLDIWGTDIDQRGRGIGKLNMCRYGDKGPYAVGNVYIGTHEHNADHGKHDSKLKPVEVDGVAYKGIGEAARAIGYKTGADLQKWLREGNPRIRKL
jgi:hypothetical protein